MFSVLRTLMIAGTAAIGFSLPTHASACTGGSTLNGSYGILVGGTSPSTGGSKFLSGLLTFNGACGLTGQITYGTYGLSNSSSSEVNFQPVTGSYNTNSDGTIQISFTPNGSSIAQVYEVGYSAFANEALGIETDGTYVATIDLQAQNWTSGYNYGSLNGTFAVSCQGVASAFSDLNYVTFDGKGNLTGYDYYNNGGNQGSAATYKGSFAVTSSGVIGGALQGSFSVFQYVGVLDNANNEIQFIYFENGAGAITTCTGKKTTIASSSSSSTSSSSSSSSKSSSGILGLFNLFGLL
jgi:hypothetical protein